MTICSQHLVLSYKYFYNQVIKIVLWVWLQLPGTQWAQEFLLTQGDNLLWFTTSKPEDSRTDSVTVQVLLMW